MSDQLYALVIDGNPPGGDTLCGSCGEEQYGDDFPDGSTPVFLSDGWHVEITGTPCFVCLKLVGDQGTY